MSTICRACLQNVNETDYFYIDTFDNAQITNTVAKDVLQLCVPEMDLYISEQPGVCSECLNMFERFYTFKNKCLATEDRIFAYLKKHNLESQCKIDLSSIVDDDHEPPLLLITDYKNDHSLSNSTIANSDPVKVYTCKSCTFITTSQVESTNHKCVFLMKKYNCPHCEYSAGRHFRLKQHINAKHTKKETYECSQCDFKSTNLNQLRRHRMSSHPQLDPVPQLSCPSCEFCSASEMALQRHRSVKHGPLIHTCGVCSYQTRDKSNFKKHLFVHSKEIRKCTKCNYECTSPYQMQRHHKRSHAPDK